MNNVLGFSATCTYSDNLYCKSNMYKTEHITKYDIICYIIYLQKMCIKQLKL